MPDSVVSVASTQYSDWLGTVALDSPYPDGVRAAFGIEEKWHVLGFELYHEAGTTVATVFAIDSEALGERTFDDLAVENGGTLPVTKLEDVSLRVDAFELLRQFERFKLVAWEGHGGSETRRMEVSDTISPAE